MMLNFYEDMILRSLQETTGVGAAQHIYEDMMILCYDATML